MPPKSAVSRASMSPKRPESRRHGLAHRQRARRGDPTTSAPGRAAIEKLGYRPNLSARSLVTSRTQRSASVLGDPRNSYADACTPSAASSTTPATARLILSGRADTHRSLARTLWGDQRRRRHPHHHATLPTTRRIVSLSVPSVTMGPGAARHPVHLTRQLRGPGRIAARHLLDLGHRAHRRDLGAPGRGIRQ